MNTVTINEKDLNVYVTKFLAGIGQYTHHACIVALVGDLGAGKTTFVQACAKALGITEPVTSPTFVIQKEYLLDTTDYPFTCMIHIDAYRLSSASELELLGWNEIIADPKNIIFIEWPSQVAGIAMPKSITCNIEINPDQSRNITTTQK